MKKFTYILLTFLTLIISSNVYAVTLEMQKSEILKEEILVNDYSLIRYEIKSNDGKVYYLSVITNSKNIYDKNIIRDKEGNLKIMNIGTDIILKYGYVDSVFYQEYNIFPRIVFGLFLLITIFIFYFGNKYLVKHKI